MHEISADTIDKSGSFVRYTKNGVHLRTDAQARLSFQDQVKGLLIGHAIHRSTTKTGLREQTPRALAAQLEVPANKLKSPLSRLRKRELVAGGRGRYRFVQDQLPYETFRLHRQMNRKSSTK